MRYINITKEFSLIELFVVITIISIFSAVVFLVLDPVTRFKDSRNSKRLTDINNILDAVHNSIDDNGGSLPVGLKSNMSVTQIGTSISDCDTSCDTATASACINLNAPLARYLKNVPTNPTTGTSAETGYYIYLNSNIITVGSCISEHNEITEVSR
jgi:type II secretory pathway pseudopilin PulG